MGTSYSFHLATGYLVTEKAINELFREKRAPAKIRMEDRYDPKTGKKVAPHKIVEVPAQEPLVMAGDVIEDDPEIFMGALCDMIGDESEVVWCWHSRINDGEAAFIVGPPMPPEVTEKLDFCYPVSCSGGVHFEALVALAPLLQMIGAKLKKLGFAPSKAIVLPAWMIG